jgi:hypothetical protein
MLRTSLALCFEIVLLLTSPKYVVGQSGTEDKPPKTPDCILDVSDFSRTHETSPEVIRLQSSLVDPDVLVTQQLIMELARKSVGEIEVSRPDPSTITPAQTQIDSFYMEQLNKFTGKYLDILVEALSQKRGEAQVESFKTAIEDQFLRAVPMQPEMQGCFQRVVASIFPSLPFEKQWLALLSSSYPMFKSAGLTAYLRQLYDSLEDHIRESEDVDSEAELRSYRSTILRRIYEENTVIGKEIIIAEITSPKPRADIVALSTLPDETLPEVDRILMHQLPMLRKNPDDYEVMAKLGIIERYGTKGLLPSVKSAYLKDTGNWNSREEAIFLSYFLRTDSQFAKQAIVKHLKERKRWYYQIFVDITNIRVSPQLCEIAKGYIDDPDREIAGAAVYAFSRSGDADVETVLWKNLYTWHKKWSNNIDLIPLDEQSYQDRLVESLLFGGGGQCKLKGAMDRLRPIYIVGRSVDGNIRFPEWHDPVRIAVDELVPSVPKFQVDFCGGFLDLEQLKAAIPRFPRGTNFELTGMRVFTTNAALDAVFKELEPLAITNGMLIRSRSDK